MKFRKDKNIKPITGWLILSFVILSYVFAGIGEPIGTWRIILLVIVAILFYLNKKEKDKRNERKRKN